MAKRTSNKGGGKGKQAAAQGAPAASPPAGKAGTSPQAAKVLHLQVKTGVKYRGAREAWYQRLLAHEGKPAAEYLTSCKEDPPSLPKSGVAEAPQGWLAFFQRTGVATLVERA